MAGSPDSSNFLLFFAAALYLGINPTTEAFKDEAGREITEIPALQLPAYFLTGRNDYNTPYQLVREYYEILEAPEKEIIVFEDSAHTPMFAENDKFSQALIDIKKQN